MVTAGKRHCIENKNNGSLESLEDASLLLSDCCRVRIAVVVVCQQWVSLNGFQPKKKAQNSFHSCLYKAKKQKEYVLK